MPQKWQTHFIGVGLLGAMKELLSPGHFSSNFLPLASALRLKQKTPSD